MTVVRRAVLALPLLAALAYDPVAFDANGVKGFLLAAGAAACCLLPGALSTTRLTLPILLFLGTRVLMAIRSPDRSWLATGVVLALVVAHHLHLSRRLLRREARPALAALLAVVSGIALVQWASSAPQAHALFANRSFAGAGIAMLLPFALTSRNLWGQAAAGLGLLALAAGRSRGGMLAAAVVLALLAARRWPRLRWPLGLGLPALVLAAGLALGDPNTVKVRLFWYRAAIELGLRSPLLGLGEDGFAREYPPIRPLEEHQISGGRIVHSVHNDLLESFVQGGAVGLLGHLVLIFAAARAARRHPAQAASLAAFLAASLVDLPMRDPALLALAFLNLQCVAARGRPLRPRWLRLLPAAALLPPAAALLAFWRADREFGIALSRPEERAAHLDRALALSPRHREALLLRGGREDLQLLLAMRPHSADALYAWGGLLERGGGEAATAHYREILRRHDRHHVLTRCRLAVLGNDPLEAEALLAGAAEADPRAFRPWGVLSLLRRERGRLDAADSALREAERRADTPEIRRERLLLEIARLREGGRAAPAIAEAAARAPAMEVERLAREALARVERATGEIPPPRLERAEGESPAEYAQRIASAKEKWRAGVAERSRGDLLEAAALSEALLRAAPDAGRCRLAAAVRRAAGDFGGARSLEAQATFLDALAALLRGEDARAAALFRRAFRDAPDLAERTETGEALREFARRHPAIPPASALTREALAGWPGLLSAFAGG